VNEDKCLINYDSDDDYRDSKDILCDNLLGKQQNLKSKCIMVENL